MQLEKWFLNNHTAKTSKYVQFWKLKRNSIGFCDITPMRLTPNLDRLQLLEDEEIEKTIVFICA